jgi:hypothetical protein
MVVKVIYCANSDIASGNVTMWMFNNGGSQLALKFGLQFIMVTPRGCGCMQHQHFTCLKIVASFKMNNMFYTLNLSNPFTYVSVDASNASLLHCFQLFFSFVLSYDLTLLKKKIAKVFPRCYILACSTF